MRRPDTRLLVDTALALAAIAGLAALALRDSPSPGAEVELADPPAGIDRLVVHIGGAVASPGLIVLERGARVADALTSAGGALPDADLDAVNLARRVEDEDEERILVPRKGDRAARLLDINHATRTQLIALAGIGEKTADRIIESRTGAPFASSDELVTRRLLSAKEYEAIRDLVTASP